MNKYKAYPSYKDSGVEWLGNIPKDWIIRRSKYIYKELHERSITGAEDLLSVSEYYGVKPRYSVMSDGEHISRADSLIDYKKCYKNDLVMNIMLAWKRGLGITNYTGIVSPAYCVFRSNNLVHPPYMHYLFRTNKYTTNFKSKSSGVIDSRLRLYPEMFGTVETILPPLPEQKTIADFLDKATSKIDKTIEQQTKLIELLKEKRQAVISHAVTKGLDPNAPMKDYRLDWVCQIVRGNSAFKKDELLESGKYVALQYGKTYKIEEVGKEFNFYVNDDFFKVGQTVQYGDTILISTSETVKDLGHSCFYARKDIGLIGGEQILLKPDQAIVFDKFLYYSSRVFCPKLGKYSTGLKVFRFNTDDLKNIFISIPNVREQKAIADYLDKKTAQIDTLVDKAKQSIELLKEKRTAIISAAVTGKIDVRGT